MAVMMVLLKSVCLSLQCLEQIFVTGRFGNHLNLENVIFISLIPDVPVEWVRIMGNNSLVGGLTFLEIAKEIR
jgi:uncharacterized 2Fe-2S/4Fe-4S cluster protein (DUF4445 family)